MFCGYIKCAKETPLGTHVSYQSHTYLWDKTRSQVQIRGMNYSSPVFFFLFFLYKLQLHCFLQKPMFVTDMMTGVYTDRRMKHAGNVFAWYMLGTCRRTTFVWPTWRVRRTRKKTHAWGSVSRRSFAWCIGGVAAALCVRLPPRTARSTQTAHRALAG